MTPAEPPHGPRPNGVPALIAILSAQTAARGRFEAFATAVMLAGVIQLAFGLSQAGFISSCFPTSVIKGLPAGVVGHTRQLVADGRIGVVGMMDNAVKGEAELLAETRHRV